jgi:hypothetical protein
MNSGGTAGYNKEGVEDILKDIEQLSKEEILELKQKFDNKYKTLFRKEKIKILKNEKIK